MPLRQKIYLSRDELKVLLKYTERHKIEYVRIDWESGEIWHTTTVSIPPKMKSRYKIPISKNDLDNL